MKNAKKIMATILVINMCILLLGGCGKNDNSTASKPNYDNLSDYIDDYNEDEDDSSDGQSEYNYSIPEELLKTIGLDKRLNEWLGTDRSVEGFNAIYGEPSDRKRKSGEYTYIYEDINICFGAQDYLAHIKIAQYERVDLTSEAPESVANEKSVYILPDKELSKNIISSSYKVFKDAKNYDDFKKIMNGIVPYLDWIDLDTDSYSVEWWIIGSNGKLKFFQAIFNISDNSIIDYTEYK